MIINLNSKFYYFTIAIITFLLKTLGDILFFLFKFNDSIYYFLWQVISFGVLSIAVFVIIYPIRINFSEIDETEFLNDTTKTIILLIFLLFLNATLPELKFHASISEILFSNLIAVIYLCSVLFFLTFVLKWLNINRHRKTSLYNSRLLFIFPSLYILTSANYFFFDNQSSIIKSIEIIILIYLIVSAFSNTKKLNWIASIEKKHKLWFILATGIALILIVSLWINIGDDSNIYYVSKKYSIGFPIIASAVYCIYLGFILRIFGSIILTIPTWNIVNKKIYEVDSLTYLNKLIANTQDFDKILDSVTNLAINTSQAHCGWIEIYDNNQNKVISFANLQPDQVDALQIEQKPYIFREYIDPMIIQDISKHPQLFAEISKIGVYQSMIIIPIQKVTERLGSLILLHSEKYGFDYDDLKILSAFSENINIAFEYAKLLKESFEKERLKKELSIARTVQQSLLPKILPKTDKYTVAIFSQPAVEVGGDYYDIFDFEDKMIVIIGDVSGKGMSAAFLMAQLKGAVLAIINKVQSTKDFLIEINNALYGKIDKNMFITINCLIINKKTNEISISRAGHMPILYRNSTESFYIEPMGIGIALANNEIFENYTEEYKMNFENGALLLLFTDGINELMNANSIEFGLERIKSLFYSLDNYEPEKCIEIVENELNIHLGNNIQNDDMTMIIIKRNY